MIFRQYQLACLSLFSYLIGDEITGRAVVIDPQRDICELPRRCRALGLQHRAGHRDPLPRRLPLGHLELAAATGAAISYGEGA